MGGRTGDKGKIDQEGKRGRFIIKIILSERKKNPTMLTQLLMLRRLF